MIPQPETLPWMTAQDVARLLGYSDLTFSRYKRRLIREEGMPCPVPGGRYNRQAVMHWHATYADRKAEAIARAIGKTIVSARVASDRDNLLEKYAARNAA